MRLADKWKDFEVIDAGDGEKLERWDRYSLVRPDPQVIWRSERSDKRWTKPDARYERSQTGGGKWVENKVPEAFKVSYRDLTFGIKLMNFKHTGLFPEQAVNWDFCADIIKEAGRPVTLLNLFAYTGAASVAAAKAGANVCHVDASKGMVSWARENAEMNGLNNIRFIVDDCVKFCERELRRGKRYDAVILDPPSYGRGPSGEIWKLENELDGLCDLVFSLLSDDPLFVLLNSYTTGLSASCMGYILGAASKRKYGKTGNVTFDEIGLPVTESGLALPCGSTAVWRNK